MMATSSVVCSYLLYYHNWKIQLLQWSIIKDEENAKVMCLGLGLCLMRFWFANELTIYSTNYIHWDYNLNAENWSFWNCSKNLKRWKQHPRKRQKVRSTETEARSVERATGSFWIHSVCSLEKPRSSLGRVTFSVLYDSLLD